MNPYLNQQGAQPVQQQNKQFNMTDLQNFAQQNNLNPQSAQQQVLDMLNSGRINEQQLNGVINQAKGFMQMFGLH